jgi:hypothetical protein
MTKTGPNDASCVVWAISKFFFSFFRVLLSLTIVFKYYLYFSCKVRVREGSDNENGPKMTPDASFWAIGEFF